MTLPKSFDLSQEVLSARRRGLPIVALESTVITHGLPRPQNLQLARELESIVRAQGATPATIAVHNGSICVGLESEELDRLAGVEAKESSLSAVARRPKADEAISGSIRKLSSRDIAAAVVDKASGGTTVAATLRIAAMVGIRVFATGGIGGVHRDSHWDVSADLAELARQPVLLVCAGAKAILDLPATLEQLETLGVPVIGYQTNNFSAFYSVESGLLTSTRADSPNQVAAIARTHWELGGGGVMLAVPPPAESALPRAEVESWITQAIKESEAQNIHGQDVSPFLLKRVSELSSGRSLEANLALLRNNAAIAAQVAKAMGDTQTKKI